MGMKGKTWPAFCVLFLVFFMSMSSIVCAQEGMCILPTGTEEVVYPLEWGTSVLGIYSSDEMVGANSPISLWVESDGYGCPPYEWTAAGQGYSLSETTTNGDFDVTILSVVSGTCPSDYEPYVTLIVTDACDNSSTTKVLNSEGRWYQETRCRISSSAPGGFTSCQENTRVNKEIRIPGTIYKWIYENYDWGYYIKGCYNPASGQSYWSYWAGCYGYTLADLPYGDNPETHAGPWTCPPAYNTNFWMTGRLQYYGCAP